MGRPRRVPTLRTDVRPARAASGHARRGIVRVALAGLMLAALVVAGSAAVLPEAAAAAKSEAHAGAVSEATSVSSGELVENPARWDGARVLFRGEAITGAMVRGDHAWVHINDDAYQLRNIEEGAPLGGYNSGHAVWVPEVLAQRIGVYGDYTHEGDVVRVEGVFNAACAQHGGDMDIHADILEVEIPGHRVHEPVKPEKALLAATLLFAAVVLWALSRRELRRRIFGAHGPVD